MAKEESGERDWLIPAALLPICLIALSISQKFGGFLPKAITVISLIGIGASLELGIRSVVQKVKNWRKKH